MDKTDGAAFLSWLAGVSVLVAGYFQWWSIDYNGGMRTRRWVKYGLFPVMVAALTVSLVLTLVPG